MSTDKPAPRGEAAWIAEKARIAERNEAAYARGREVRAQHDAKVRAGRQAADLRDRANLPTQPRPR